jgi:hypothetical protein
VKIRMRVFTRQLDSKVFVLDTDPASEQKMVLDFALHLKEKFPGNDWKVVKIGRKRYNVIPQAPACA